MNTMAADPIKIGAPGPYTGASAPMGVSMRDAMRIAVKEINDKGGVLGRPLELVERDDEAKNERGNQVAQDLIYNNKIVAAVGVINTGVMLASQRFYQESKIPVVTPGPSGTEVTKTFLPYSYIFTVSLPDRIQAEMIVKEAVENRNFKKVAILADSTNYGQLVEPTGNSAQGKRHRAQQKNLTSRTSI
jgi:branched-chain amino acid transport system substrate-binding protein